MSPNICASILCLQFGPCLSSGLLILTPQQAPQDLPARTLGNDIDKADAYYGLAPSLALLGNLGSRMDGRLRTVGAYLLSTIYAGLCAPRRVFGYLS